MNNIFKKTDFYTLDKIKGYNPLFYVIVAGRNRGKSFAVKKEFIDDAVFKGKKFALIFREKGTKTQKQISNYLTDKELTKHINKITKNKYDGVACKESIIYLYYFDDKGKKIYDLEVGSVFYLEFEESYKSMVYTDYYNILFEEFISRYGYLYNEVTIFESVVSSILRFNIYSGEAKIILVGNTISRVCPYSSEWGLNIANQQDDTIEIVEIERTIEGEPFKFKIACERLKNKESGISISQKGKQMDSGEWETGKIPLFKGKKSDYDVVYEFVYYYQGFCFLLNCLSKDDELFIFCEKKTTPIKKDTRVISDVDSFNPLHTKDFIPITQNERIIFNILKQNKIFFSDALTGADFYNCLQSQKKEIKYL